jgi:predicted transposase YdaD
MSYDNLTKILAEKYPDRFATWLLGIPQTNVEILKTELSIEPIRADSLTFLKTLSRILHIEFQTRWLSEPPINFQMLDYWVRLYRYYRLPITKEVGKIESTTQRQEVSSYVQLMAGLRFDKTLIKKLFQEDIMKESVIYQEIFETGEQQGLQREKAYIIRQIVKKVGEMPQELRSTIELLSIDQLEVLGEALLDFTNLQDLQNWLRAT